MIFIVDSFDNTKMRTDNINKWRRLDAMDLPLVDDDIIVSGGSRNFLKGGTIFPREGKNSSL